MIGFNLKNKFKNNNSKIAYERTIYAIPLSLDIK